MKKLSTSITFIITVALFAVGCGPAAPSAADKCNIQQNSDDCEILGSNILALSEEFADYTCVWQNNACVAQKK